MIIINWLIKNRIISLQLVNNFKIMQQYKTRQKSKNKQRKDFTENRLSSLIQIINKNL